MAIVDQYIRELSLRRDRVPSFDDYPFNVPCVRHLDTLPLRPKVTYSADATRFRYLPQVRLRLPLVPAPLARAMRDRSRRPVLPRTR